MAKKYNKKKKSKYPGYMSFNKGLGLNPAYGQDGGELTGMMKARLAYAQMHGNPSAQRMVAPVDNPYVFEDGDTGTHYMASMGEYAVPQIQNINNNLVLGNYGPESLESIRFDRPEDAEYFAENYKQVAPALRKNGGWLDEFEEGGRIKYQQDIGRLPQDEDANTLYGPVNLPAVEISDKADPRALINQGAFFGKEPNKFVRQYKNRLPNVYYTEQRTSGYGPMNQGSINLPSTDISAPFVDSNTGEVDYGKMAFAGLEGIASGFVGTSTPKIPKPPKQLSNIDYLTTINISRGSSKPKSKMYKASEVIEDPSFNIKKIYRGSKELPKVIRIKGKSGEWIINRASDGSYYFNAAMSNPLESGKAMLKINELLPPKPTILEPNSLSLDSYKNIIKLGQRPHWKMEFENYIPLNHSAINNKTLSGKFGFNPEGTTVPFNSLEDANIALKEVNAMLKKQGIKQQADVFGNGNGWYGIKIPNFKLSRDYKQGGFMGKTTVEAGGAKHVVYTGKKGDIMVTHPEMDNGAWDTINLTEVSDAKSLAQGVDATLDWHRKHPYHKKKAYGGKYRAPKYNDKRIGRGKDGGEVWLYNNGGRIKYQQDLGYLPQDEETVTYEEAIKPEVSIFPKENAEMSKTILYPEQEIVADRYTGESLPYYNILTEEEKGLLNDEGPIGRNIRAKAKTGETSYTENDIGSILGPAIDIGFKMTGIPGAYRILEDPMGKLSNVASAVDQAIIGFTPFAGPMGMRREFTNEETEGVFDALDAAGIAGSVLAPIKALPLARGLRAGNTFLNKVEPLQVFRNTTSATPTFDLEELRRVYHNSERFLQPDEARYLWKYGHGKPSQYINPNNFDWSVSRTTSNQLAPPPSELIINPNGEIRTIYNQQPITDYIAGSYAPDYVDLRRPINGFQPGTPEWDRLNDIITQSRTSTYKPKPVNKSGLTKEEVIAKAAEKDKDKLSKMTETEFENTVVKPNGEIVEYTPAMDLNLQWNKEAGKTLIPEAVPLSSKEYADTFNENIDLLNDIIEKNNKSGVKYKVVSLHENGLLRFKSEHGNTAWVVDINPGLWQGQVQDIANADYYKSIPGLNMAVSSSGVFPESSGLKGIPGTKAYQSINEYLKKLNLGRVKPGFNSQTETIKDSAGKIIQTGSKDVWENFINSGRGVGFYGNPSTVYGSLKSALPYVGISGTGALYLNNKRNRNQEYKQGGWLDEL